MSSIGDAGASGASASISSEMRTFPSNSRKFPQQQQKRDYVSNQSETEKLEATYARENIYTPNNVAGPVPVAKSPIPPLTPPSPVEGKRSSDELELRQVASSLSGRTTVRPVTPNMQDPPTPDITPPPETPSKRPTVSRIDPSQSSRAESFWTAIGNVSADGEMDNNNNTPWRSNHPLSSPQSPLLQSSFRRDGLSPFDFDLASTEVATPSSNGSIAHHTQQLDGFAWTRTDSRQHDPPKLIVGKRGSSRKHDGVGSHGMNPLPSASASNNHAQSPTARRTPMRHESRRDKVAQDGPSNPSVERSREEVKFPTENSSPNVTVTEKARTHRLSASPSTSPSTSTIEAIIIESSPQSSPRPLRHIEKTASLRSVSSPLPLSQLTLPTSKAGRHESQHRLVRRPARITEQDRSSLVTEIPISKSSTYSARQEEVNVVPVVVVPQRSSSLNFSVPPKKTKFEGPSQRSCRQAGAKGRSDIASAKIPRQRKWAESDPASGMPANTVSSPRGRSSGPPVIPPRSSSLSAPTSKNTSRATSLTQESLRQHTLAMDLEHHQKNQEKKPASETSNEAPILDTHEVSESPKSPSAVPRFEDTTHLRPRPLSLPYTQNSFQSSSPGSVEINQATAVNLYPHKNTSLLLVEQNGQYGPRPSYQLRTKFRNDFDHPQTPEAPWRADSMNVDSPLTNPRAPPKPPTSEMATPDLTERTDHRSEALNNIHKDSDPIDRRRCRFGSIRRTSPVRPNSESLPSFTRSFSLKSAKNQRAGKVIDSRLQPFWRPRGFWEDLNTEESGPSSPEELNREMCIDDIDDDENRVSGSLGTMPHSGQMIFEGPPSLARRSPELRRLVDGLSRQSRRRNLNLIGTNRMFKRGEMFRARARSPSSSRYLRYRVFPLRSLRMLARRMLQRRTEAKREANREKIKKSIVVLKEDF